MQRKLVPAILAASLLALSIPAEASRQVLDNGKIEGSYIIGFKKPEKGAKPIVTPALRIEDRLDKTPPPFGEHSTGQSRAEVASALGLAGDVVSIYDAINAIHVHIDEKEAERLRRHPLVDYVEQNGIATAARDNPGWGLDRLDEPGAPTALDNHYDDGDNLSNGAGQTIYILDSGLNLNNANLIEEFGARASIIYDVNGGTGNDCDGHGTMVASAAAGSTKGVASGATLKIAKITNSCGKTFSLDTSVMAFNWLADNAPRGTIANWSMALTWLNCAVPYKHQPLEDAIRAAYQAGIIVVVAAGNDGCDTANYSPTNIPEAFVVGATGNDRRYQGKDEIWQGSRKGWNIAGFAPGFLVDLMDQFGNHVSNQNGTSYAAPYVAGLFAIACQNSPISCSIGSTGAVYDAMKQTATAGTVTNTDGSPLTGAYSRFFWKPAW